MSPLSINRKEAISWIQKSPNIERSWFTLIELLISLTIGALLLGGISSFLTSWIETTRKTSQRIQPDEKQRYLDQALKEIQFTGITWIQPFASGTGYMIFSHDKNYILKETTGTWLCKDERVLPIIEFSEFIKNSGHENTTASGWVYSIASNGLTILSWSTVIFWSGIQWGKITSWWPLFSELWWASALTHTGNTLIVSDPNNHRLISINTNNPNSFSAIDTLDYGIEYPLSASFTASWWLEIAWTKTAILLEDFPNWTFTGGITVQIRNTSWSDKTITEIQTTLSGTSITDIGTVNSIKYSPSATDLITDPTDTYSLIWTDTASYVFTWASTIAFDNWETIAIEYDWIDLNYSTGSWKEYYGEIRVLNWTTIEERSAFHYSTVWDGNVLSASGNTFKKTTTGINLRKASWVWYLSWALSETEVKIIWETRKTVTPTRIQGITPTDDWKWYILSLQKYPYYDCTISDNIYKLENFYIKKTD